MTPEQRYFFDVTGYLHLEGVLHRSELHSAQEAAQRYIDTPGTDLPSGFKCESKGTYLHGFAFDKSLEALTLHPSFWPLVVELTNDRPRLTTGNLRDQTHEESYFGRLHCAREGGGGPEMPTYFVQDSRMYSNFLVVFVYLTDVFPSDGGLIVVPGSHKSQLPRPDGLFAPNSDTEVTDPEPPPAVTNITPKAGDVVIISEMLTHGVLIWKPQDRSRRFLLLRYMSQFSAYSVFETFPKEIEDRLSPETRELIAYAHHSEIKEIVGEPGEWDGFAQQPKNNR